MCTPYDPIQVAFDNAIREFRTRVNDDAIYDKILQTRTIDQVYAATDKLQAEQAEHGHLRHLSKIEPYLTRLGDYAHAVEVFIQVKPGILALIWGPIVLILQWATVLKTSFDAIVGTTAEIGLALPEFKQAALLFGENHLIKDVLLLFFKDILEFYAVALSFFRLPRWRYVFEMLWPKYRDKIRCVSTNIERNTLLLRRDVQSEHVRQEHEARARAQEYFKTAEENNHRQEYNGIRTDVSPVRYDKKLNSVRSSVCEGTGKWLMEDTVFEQWLSRSEPSKRALWLQGIPGSGKTFLTSTVVDEARRRGRTLFAFLSYNFASTTSALSVLHSFIFQLASGDRDLETVVCGSSRDNLRSNLEVAVKIFSSLLDCAGPVYVTIDGVDEIDERERYLLLSQLLAVSETSEQLRLFVSSRPEADLKSVSPRQSRNITGGNAERREYTHFRRTTVSEMGLRKTTLHRKQQTKCDEHWLLWLLNQKNELGMFLYARIVLDSIATLDNLSDIQNELEVLPENLDAAYGRIISRINSQQQRLRERARKILGWISCTPRPLTVHEIQQALTIRSGESQGKSALLVELRVDKICGPIVEVVDGYIQFVHFTAKEYVSCPNVAGYISNQDSILSLATCCLEYLRQRHHEPELPEQEIYENALAGSYVLHDFAATTWLELVERSITFDRSGSKSTSLIEHLESLFDDRCNPDYVGEAKGVPASLKGLGESWSGLLRTLCETVRFRQDCATSQYRRENGSAWVNLDPLTISHTSIHMHEAIEMLLKCHDDQHSNKCNGRQIRKLYGSQPFKCSFVDCPMRRTGFETRAARRCHEKHHDRPWKCSFPACEYAEGGFLTLKMRNDHLDRYHQAPKPGNHNYPPVDEDEITPLLYDLVQADDVEAVRALLPSWKHRANLEVEIELLKLAAAFASSSMLATLKNDLRFWDSDGPAQAAIKYNITETLEFILETSPRCCADVFPFVLESESLEIYGAWKKYVSRQLVLETPAYKSTAQTKYGLSAAPFLMVSRCQCVAGHPSREELMLNLWEKEKILEAVGQSDLGGALIEAVIACCSVKVVRTLLEAGADVDYRRSLSYLTALHYAARNTSPEAAELARFLLRRGADPNARATRSRKKMEEEKGARDISKHLGITWDELVAQTRKERENYTQELEISEEAASSSTSPSKLV